MAIETREKFIIQNFRSWKGKAYINLNNLTFLFGANSSGKSSLIKALGLLQQSMPTDKRSMVFADNIFDRLVPNGTNVKLGRIRSQKYRRTDDQKTIEEEIKRQEKFNPSATEPDYRIGDLLAFGWCWHHHPTFSKVAVVTILEMLFWKCLITIRDNFYCHPTTGENVGFEYRLGEYSAFKILKR